MIPTGTRRSGVDVVILNFHGQQILADCLRAVLASRMAPNRIVIVDNSPADGALAEAIRVNGVDASRLTTCIPGGNVGFCAGFNLGMKFCDSEFILLLNNDTQISLDAIERLYNFMRANPAVGLCEGKVVNTGLSYVDRVSNPSITGWFGILSEAGPPEADHGQFDSIKFIFSAIGVWPMVRGTALDELGGYDSDFFIMEEIRDWCWRMWLAGYEVAFVPKAVTRHAARLRTSKKRYGTSVMMTNMYHEAKNSSLILLKNLSMQSALRMLPVNLAIRCIELIWLAFSGKWAEAEMKLKGYFWTVAHMRTTLAKRARIQQTRKVCDSVVLSLLVHGDPLDQFRRHQELWE